MGAFTQWIASRVPVSGEQLRELTNEPVPQHLKRWWFCLGGTPAFLFGVQIATGILLAVYYQPASGTAYESIEHITNRVAYGWYLRSLHKWGATLMIAAVVLHQMRVYFTGAYRAPRELNWMIGMCLLVVTLVLGFTGYSLVYEQLSYWGATVGANIGARVPVAGGLLKTALLGGDQYNARTLSRLYILHVALLPAFMCALLVLHIALLRLHGIAVVAPAPPGEPPTFNFFPDHLLTEMMVGLSLMILLSALACIHPATMGPPADPLSTPDAIKPEWYFYVAFRWLKLFSGTFAVLSLGFVLFVMFVWPLIDSLLERVLPRREASVWIGIVAVLAIVGFTLWEAAFAH